MKNYKKEGILLLTLASLFLSGLVFIKSTYAAGPLADPLATVKNSIQVKLDGGDSVAEAVCQIVKDVADDKKTKICADTTTAAIKMKLDTQDVVASAIGCGCNPVAVGNAAYNAGADLHDIYMAGGSTNGGKTGLSYAPDDVEQPTDLSNAPDDIEEPTDKRASPSVPKKRPPRVQS